MEKIIYYSDFGAKGDGKTNDFYAMKKAHERANEIGAKVLGEPGKIYYIDKTGGESITVKTDTDFCGASVIIDDRNITPSDAEREAPIFIIKSDSEPLVYGEESEEVKALKAACPFGINTKKLPLAFGFPAMIIPYDDGKRIYIRRGNTPNSGTTQREIVVIDGDGNIDETTPVLLPYNNVTSLTVYRIDDKPITFENGSFTTRANKAPREYTYYLRSILICRSNVSVKNIAHYITDEGEDGAPYDDFLSASRLNNLYVVDCVFTAHKTYWETSGRSLMGTYDIGGRYSNNMYFKNCRQTNFYREDGERNTSVWGIMGSNFCKNITYDGCLLSRFDAHAGVYNGAIIDSTVATVRLTGGGKFLLKNSTVYGYGDALLSLREDYGSTWRGDIEIVNSHFKNEDMECCVFGAEFYPEHNFGYQAYYPENIIIDGLSIENPVKFYLFSDIAKDCDYNPEAKNVKINGEICENKNVTTLPKNVEIKRYPENALSFEGSPNKKLNSLLKFKI